jgi:hypothetical protein
MTEYTPEQREAYRRIQQDGAPEHRTEAGSSLIDMDDFALLVPLLPEGLTSPLPEPDGWYVSVHNEAWWHYDGAWWKHGNEMTNPVDVEEHLPLIPLSRPLNRDQVIRALNAAADPTGVTIGGRDWVNLLHQALVKEQTS